MDVAQQLNRLTVNSKEKDIKTVNSLQRTQSSIIGEEIDEEGMALELAEKLDDIRSIKYYTLLAKNVNHQFLFEALSLTRDADRQGRIRKNKAVYFLAILRNHGVKVKFKS